VSKENKDKSAFPAKVNAMGYEGGLTKLEFMATLIMSMQLVDKVRPDLDAVRAVNAAEALLAELEKRG
jgi:hypothetical protein